MNQVWNTELFQQREETPPKSRRGRAGLLQIVAPITRDVYSSSQILNNTHLRVDEVERVYQSQATPFYRFPYGLYQEMVSKDSHLWAVIMSRKMGVLSQPRELIEHKARNSTSEKVRLFVQDVLNDISSDYPEEGFEKDLREILDAIGYGFSISELVWKERDGQWVVDRILSRHVRRFTFDINGNPRLLTKEEPRYGVPLDLRYKFLYFSPYGEFENPYGKPLYQQVFFPCWFKKMLLKYWIGFAERFGSPLMYAKHPPGMDDDDLAEIESKLASVQQETAFVYPDTMEVDSLEVNQKGANDTYPVMAEFLNGEISKAILGATHTVEQTKSAGSYAMARVHFKVKGEIVETDGKALEALINHHLIRWIVDLNFPPEQRLYPRWRFLSEPVEDSLSNLEVDKGLEDLGVHMSTQYYYERYGRPVPRPDDELAVDHKNSVGSPLLPPEPGQVSSSPAGAGRLASTQSARRQLGMYRRNEQRRYQFSEENLEAIENNAVETGLNMTVDMYKKAIRKWMERPMSLADALAQVLEEVKVAP